MKINCLQTILSEKSRCLGRLIGRRPLYFFVIPVIICGIVSVGVIRIQPITDIPFLFTADNGPAMRDKRIVETLFPMNTSYNFDKLKLTDDGVCLSLILTAKDGGDIMREQIFSDIVVLDNLVRNISVPSKNGDYKFKEVCAKNNGHCDDNEGLVLAAKVRDFRRGSFSFKFPIDKDPITQLFNLYSFNLGGVTVDKDYYAKDVKAFRLFYFLDNDGTDKENKAKQWENFVIEQLDKLNMEHINIFRFGSSSLGDEINNFTKTVMPLGGISALVILVFSVVTLMSSDMVKSKPWLGVAGCFSACMAVLTAFGSVIGCGLEYSDLNVALPFLILGMGIDDSYVLIAAWRRTKPTESVEYRMGHTFAEAAVSISITSLTNFLSFCIGIITPFPVVKLFCIYAATAVFFTYVYQMTFFGGCMALSGYREEKQLNPFTLRETAGFKRVINGKYRYDINEDHNSEHYLMKVFSNTLGEYLTHLPVKIAVMVICLGNLLVAIWGVASIEEGLDAKDSLSVNSRGRNFLDLHYRYFTDYPYRLHLVINKTLDYSDSSVQNEIENLLRELEASPYISDAWLTESWLRSYKEFINSSISRFSLSGYDMENKDDFYYGLRYVFLRFRQATPLRSDVVFNEDGTEILSTKFILLCENVRTKDNEKNLLTDVRNVISKSPIPVTVHSAWFPVYEQIIAVRSMAIHTICIAAGVVMVAFFLFAPNLKCALCVTGIVAIVEVETLGYMSLWNVHLDLLSVICLVMCVGFSVNYPAHLTYAYVTATGATSHDKMKNTLYAIGLPVFQGSVSTFLGVAVLALYSFYFLTLFFKIITLVVLFTAFHALFVLPVLLTMFEFCKEKANTTTNKITQNGHHCQDVWERNCFLPVAQLKPKLCISRV